MRQVLASRGTASPQCAKLWGSGAVYKYWDTVREGSLVCASRQLATPGISELT